MIKVSVVTIAFNAADVIADTVESVLAQTFNDFEYVIIDGESKDHTVSIIEKYKEKFNNKNISLKIVCEPDDGIYDAMNKGIDRSNGDWIIFMNAGDCFFSKDVLSNFFLYETEQTDVLYGDTIETEQGYYKKRANIPLSLIYKQMPFCHQSVLMKRKVLQKYRFNTEYKIAADYDLFVGLYINKYRIVYIPEIISIYDNTGISERNQHLVRAEYNLIKKKYNVASGYDAISAHVYSIYINIKRRLAKKFLPQLYYSEKRGWYADICFFNK